MHAHAGLSERIRARGAELGFERIGFSRAGPSPRSDALRQWIAGGLAGSMSYMEKDVEGRADPTRRSPWARSVVSAALHYDPPPPRTPGQDAAGARPTMAGAAGGAGADAGADVGTGAGIAPLVSSYAVGQDYHDVMRIRLGELARFVREEAGGRAEARALVDTSAVLERDIGSLGGIGWTGKNAMLIDPRAGSYFFLGEVLTSVEIEPTGEMEDLCGTCTACLDACPTGAIVGPRVVDARRCLSYLTIEHRGAVPHELRTAIGAHLFGCDVCQEVCPWNRHAAPGACETLSPGPGVTGTTLEEAVALDDRGFSERFRRTAIARGHRSGLVRNALLVAANTGSAAALAAGSDRLTDADASVRETAVWALARGDRRERERAARAAEAEPDPAVRASMLRDLDESRG